MPTSKNRETLRKYLFDGARDLLARGVARRQRGQLIEDVIRAEAPAILEMLWSDLKSVATELGMSLALDAKTGLERAAARQIGGMFEEGMKKVFEFMTNGSKK